MTPGPHQYPPLSPEQQQERDREINWQPFADVPEDPPVVVSLWFAPQPED